MAVGSQAHYLRGGDHGHDLIGTFEDDPMTPDEQMRLQAMMLADKRSPADASTEAVIKEAEKILKFLKAGVAVA